MLCKDLYFQVQKGHNVDDKVGLISLPQHSVDPLSHSRRFGLPAWTLCTCLGSQQIIPFFVNKVACTLESLLLNHSALLKCGCRGGDWGDSGGEGGVVAEGRGGGWDGGLIRWLCDHISVCNMCLPPTPPPTWAATNPQYWVYVILFPFPLFIIFSIDFQQIVSQYNEFSTFNIFSPLCVLSSILCPSSHLCCLVPYLLDPWPIGKMGEAGILLHDYLCQHY